MNPIRFLVGLMTAMLLASSLAAVEPAPRISDREIIEGLAALREGQKVLEERFLRLEEGQKAILREMDQRFEAVQNSMDKRFEAIDKRLEEQSNLMVGMMQTFGGIVLVMIGFAIWDRRTMIRPFETKIRHIEKQLEPLEPLALEMKQDHQRLQSLLAAVRALAKNNTEASEILKTAFLL